MFHGLLVTSKDAIIALPCPCMRSEYVTAIHECHLMNCCRNASAQGICRRVLEASSDILDMWLVLAGLPSSTNAAIQIYDEALTKNPLSAQLYHAAAKHRMSQVS